MATSALSAPLENLVAFKKYAESIGARLTEGLPEDPVNARAHGPNSFHKDTSKYQGTTHSHAIDVNFGPAGTSAAEREMLTHLCAVAKSMNLGYIYALKGTVGAAAQHRGHLHVDRGSFRNFGTGSVPVSPGDLCVRWTQMEINAVPDNLNGSDTKKRLYALREASRYGGEDFPYGVKFAQDVVGTKTDNVWGTNSRQAHDDTIWEVQGVWKKIGIYTGKQDHIWGDLMEAAYKRFLARY